MSTLKGIIIDLDDTLYDYQECHHHAVHYTHLFIANKLKLDLEVVINKFEEAKQKVKMSLDRTASSHNRLLYYQTFCELLNVPSLLHAKEFSDYYWTCFFKKMKPFVDVNLLLKLCKHYDIKTCILTDFNVEFQYKKLEVLGLQNQIDFIVSSEEVVFEKPSPIMFLTALHKLKCKPSEVYMIGDSFSKDIMGANNLGIKSFYLTNKDSIDKLSNGVTAFYNFLELTEMIIWK